MAGGPHRPHLRLAMDPTEIAPPMRLNVETHVRKKLTDFYPHVLPRVINAEASAIETNAFARAKSCGEYLAIVSSYNSAHEKRKKRGNDAYRIHKLNQEEERDRIVTFNAMIKEEQEKIRKAIQKAEAARAKQRNAQSNAQPNVQTAAQPAVQAPLQVFPNSNPQQNIQQPLQQPVLAQHILQQQTIPQQQLQHAIPQPHIGQTIPQQQIPQQFQQLQANMVNAQAMNQPMVTANPQTVGMNIINPGNVQPVQNMQPMFAAPPPNAVNPGGFRYVFPAFSGAQPQGVQQTNGPANPQQIYYPIFVDPRFLAQASTNPTVIQNQASVPNAASTPQASQTPPHPVGGSSQNQSAQPAPNGAHFTDDMITQLAHQTAQAVTQSAPNPKAPAGRGTSRGARSRRSREKQRKIAPNVKVQDRSNPTSRITTEQKSDLVAKWINLQREYRPRIERIRDVLSMILKDPSPEQVRIFQELNGAKSLLQAPVGQLMGDGYTEQNYMKASAYLRQIVLRYKKFEEMNWAEVTERVLHIQRTQNARNAQLHSSVPNLSHQLNESHQTPLVREQPLPPASLSNASQRRINSQASRHQNGKNGKLTTNDGQNEVPNRQQTDRSEEEMRVMRSRAAAAIARRHRMNNASLHSGRQNQGSASGAAAAAEAAKQALVSKAGEAAMAAASASYNARKRTASQMGTVSRMNEGPLQKKASTSQIGQSASTSIPRLGPAVQGAERISQETRGAHPAAIKQTTQQEIRRNPTVSAPVAEKIQKVVQEHVRSNVTQHVHNHIKTVITNIGGPSIVNTNRVNTGGVQSLSVTTKQQNQVEQPKEITPPRIAEKQGPAEQEQQENRLLSVTNSEPLEQQGSGGHQVSTEDPSWNRFPADESIPIIGLSNESEKQVSNTLMTGNESRRKMDGDHAAEKEVDLSALDNVDLNPLSPTDIAVAIEGSMEHLKRALEEDPFVRDALNDATVSYIDDEEVIDRFQALLDGEEIPRNRSLRVKETLKALQGEVAEPKPPPKPKSTRKLSLNDQVEEECKAFEETCNFIKCDLHQEYKKPVILCKALIEDVLVPNLVVRVFKGYPGKEKVTYSFEEPSMGWCGPLKDIRSMFIASMDSLGESCRVFSLLEAWKLAIRDATRQKGEGNR